MKRKVLAGLLCVAMGVTTMTGAVGVFVADDAAETTVDMDGVDVDNTKIGISIYQFADNFMTLYRTELVRYLT